MRKRITVLLVFLVMYVNAQCWKVIDAGGNFCLGIKTDGTLWAWGGNGAGQLGDGTIISKTSPIQIGTATNWKTVSCGWDFSLAIKTDGTLWAWGQSFWGQLGIGINGPGPFTYTKSPAQVGTATNWQTISAGRMHSLAIKMDGTLWACGFNSGGQLGDGTTIDKNVFIQLGTLTNWKAIEGGDNFSLAIKTDSTLWAWGTNGLGQLGNGSTTGTLAPMQIGTATNWLSISTGNGTHCHALKNDSTLWAWGNNVYGQLGDGTFGQKLSPVQIGIATNWKEVDDGNYHSLAIKTDGTLWAWGKNTYGELGDATVIDKNSPIQIGLSTNWQAIAGSGGGEFSLGLKTDGFLWGWGQNAAGQLGDGTLVDKSSGVLVNNPTCSIGIVEISSNKFYSIYPNPVANILYIRNTSNTKIDAVIVFDITGRKILEQKGNTSQINIEALEPGIYQLQITSECRNYSGKFIKE